jgi:glycosyltransferase involved in cell wall biosynthesis
MKQSHPPLVSIMMPAYNAAAYIGQAIESVLAQTYPHWELILVNDGSTDETADIAAAYADERIHLIHQENGGEAAARNTALGHMSGDLLAFLDADDLYKPHHLQTAVDYLRHHPHHPSVYMDGHYIDQEGKVMEPLSSQRRGPFSGDIFEQVVRASDVFGPPTCTVLNRAVVVEHGLTFDTDIVIGPDWDFLTHYAQFAHFGYVDESTCLYRVHQSNVTVRVDLERRALYTARCREKAIQLPRFADCSLATRRAVFYELLVEMLNGHPQRQTAVLGWPQFQALPAAEQARLLRLMFREGLLRGIERPYLDAWLQQARQKSPTDRRGAWLYRLYDLSPALCHLFLRTKDAIRPKGTLTSPFGNLTRR